MELPTDLPPPLVPIAWLLGTWQGVGSAAIHDRGSVRAGDRVQPEQKAVPTHPWLLDRNDGYQLRPLAQETSSWRTADSKLEVLLAHPPGSPRSGTARSTAPRSSCVPTWWPAPARPRPIQRATGSTGWSTATCSGPTTWPPSTSRETRHASARACDMARPRDDSTANHAAGPGLPADPAAPARARGRRPAGARDAGRDLRWRCGVPPAG